MSTERRFLLFDGSDSCKFRIAFARDASGAFPASEFLDVLDARKLAQVIHRIKLLANTEPGAPRNPELFGVLEDGIFEIKSFQIRIPFAYAKSERGVILLLSGFLKKKQKTPPGEIAKAKRVFREDAQTNKVRSITASQRERRQ